MTQSYRVRVFGKAGCTKCDALKQRLGKLLARDEWKDFEQEYLDVETEDGMIAFSEAECLNPQRIPAMLVTRPSPDGAEFEPVPNPAPGAEDPVCRKSRLYQHLGLQTDYSESGRGVITPKMITTVLSQACA